MFPEIQSNQYEVIPMCWCINQCADGFYSLWGIWFLLHNLAISEPLWSNLFIFLPIIFLCLHLPICSSCINVSFYACISVCHEIKILIFGSMLHVCDVILAGVALGQVPSPLVTLLACIVFYAWWNCVLRPDKKLVCMFLYTHSAI